jgi:hypothetical protein
MKYSIIKNLAEDIVNKKASIRKYKNHQFFWYFGQDLNKTSFIVTEQEKTSIYNEVKKMQMQGELTKKNNLAEDYLTKKVLFSR